MTCGNIYINMKLEIWQQIPNKIVTHKYVESACYFEPSILPTQPYLHVKRMML